MEAYALAPGNGDAAAGNGAGVKLCYSGRRLPPVG